MCKEAPALKAAIARRAHQPTRDCFPMCDQRLRTTRGGVIARVWRSIRQKSNRPLRSMQVPTNGATAICYHGSDAYTYRCGASCSPPKAWGCSLPRLTTT
jgi:hypothetical protein